MNIERVADANAQHRARHFAVEGPVAEGRSFREAPFKFDGEQIDPHRLRRTIADRLAELRLTFCEMSASTSDLRRRPRRDDELPLHAGELVTGHAADVDEVTSCARAEHELVLAPRRLSRGDFASCSGKTMSCSAPSPLIRVICTTWPSAAERIGIDLPVDRCRPRREDHSAFGDARAQRVSDIRDVADGRPCTCSAGGCAGAAAEEASRLRRRGGGCHRSLLLLRGLRAAAEANLPRDRRSHPCARSRSSVLETASCFPECLLRIEQICVERRDIPNDCRGLQRGRIVELGISPAFLPNIPARLGPSVFLPGSNEWHAWHLR